MTECMETEFKGKTVAVVGLARSGLACCEVLTALGADVVAWDGKPAGELAEAAEFLQTLGLSPVTGGAALEYDRLEYVVTSPGVRRDAPVLQKAVAAGVPVLGEIEAAYRIARAPILAITGTNGKTTTTVLLGEMLRAAGRQTFVAGNIAAGDIAQPLIKAAFEAPADAVIVAEISSFQLEWISTFRPKVAALLNITPDHGDRQTWNEYVAAKWRIFEFQTPDDFAVVREDLIPPMGWPHFQAQVLTFGFQALPEIALPGAHNAQNVHAASLMAQAFGIGPDPIRHAARTFPGVVHRLESVDTVGGVKYVNNSMCTNADAFEKSLQALPEPKVVILGGVWKGGDLYPLATAVVENSVRAAVLIGRSAPEIEAALRAAGYSAVVRAGTMPEAVAEGARRAHPGDIVLLAPACASFDQFRDFEDRGDRFKAEVSKLR